MNVGVHDFHLGQSSCAGGVRKPPPMTPDEARTLVVKMTDALEKAGIALMDMAEALERCQRALAEIRVR